MREKAADGKQTALEKQRKRRAPVKYTPEIAEEICRRLAAGETLRKICRTPGMPDEAAVRVWALENKEGFAECYARARELGYQVWADEIIDLSDDATGDYIETGKTEDGAPILKLNHENVNRSRLRVDSRKWLLAKALPKIYGDRVAAELSGPNGKPIDMNASVDVVTLARWVALIFKNAQEKLENSNDQAE